MKVNGFQPPNSVSPQESNRSSTQQKVEKSGGSDKPQQAEVITHFSRVSQNVGNDINQARVDELREAIRDGKLTMRTDKIADALISSLTDDLS